MLVFWTSGKLRDSKKGKIKEHACEFLRWIQKSCSGPSWDQRYGNGVPWRGQGIMLRHGIHLPSSAVRLTSIFRVRACFHLKGSIYTPDGLHSDVRNQRSKTHKQIACSLSSVEIGAGNRYRNRLGWFHPLRHWHLNIYINTTCILSILPI
jgi:hypothetical protein